MATVILRKPALINMIVASLEAYKREAYGILLGKKKGNDYTIRYAITYHTAKRHYDWVSVSKRREKRINSIVKYLTQHSFAGDYHSHADYPMNLSKWDKKEMRKHDIRLSLLVFVKDTNRRVKWGHKEDRSLTGTVASKFYVKILAFEYNKKLDSIRKLKIRCPYTRELNKVTNEIKKLQEMLYEAEEKSRRALAVKRKLQKKL